ncbi:response regulator [Bacillus sp. FJAT-49732]|uniref:histidine kinase n=1 Tax=Lederbergia citrisecunda TaxID=2833583 RepID=A0A942TPZ3_9BACI|nr:ATP-binding protein [Lederbergia citrisecunda]MBS4202365.1 response regulator [Lederbergia citrisecunda]
MSIRKIIFIVTAFLVILTFFRLLWLNFYTVPAHPRALHGELDLRNWESITEYSIPLDGEWEYYPGLFIIQDNDELHSTNEKREYVQVPHNWKGSGDSSSTYGFGSYRLRIKVDPLQGKTYGIRILNISNSSEIYVNGKLLAQSGAPSQEKQTYKPLNSPYTVYLPLEKEEEIDLVIQVANYDDPLNGGIVRSLKFGLEGPLRENINFSTGIVLIACVIYMIHSLYSFILFLVGDRDKRLLYFSLMILCVVIGTLSGERLLLEWFPINFDWSIKVIYLSAIAGGYFLLQCIRQQLPGMFRTKLFTPYVSSCGLLVLLILFLPATYNIKLTLVYTIVMLIPCFLALLIVYRATTKIDKDSIFLLLAGVAAIGSLIWLVIIMVLQIEMISYPFDLMIATICFATYWFKKYFHVLDDSQSLTKKLQEAAKQKDEFLLTVAHEMRNPLHGILNISQAVKEREKDSLGKKSIQDMELINTVGRHMSLLLNDLLELERFKENRIMIQTRDVSLHSVVEVVMSMLRFMTEGKPIELVNRVPKDFPYVSADENRLNQILFNLLYNSIKYTHDGEVSVHASIKDNMARISVRDTGIGIDEDFLSKVFELYAQAPSLMEGGFGLGLSICKQLVELHGGNMKVQSTLGEGSVFTFTLKLSNTSTQREVEINSEPMEGVKQQNAIQEVAVSSDLDNRRDAVHQNMMFLPIRILAVDDDPVNLKVLESIFETDQYYIYTTTSGQNALSMLYGREWDLVIADVMMPNMSGYELTSLIREQYSILELPILLLTAYNRVEDIEAGFQVGANDYVTKPVNALELKSRVQSLTNLKKSVSERLRLEAAWLQAQIKPHFIINTFNSIAALSRINLDRMDTLIHELSTYIRLSIDSQNTHGVAPLSYELELVRSYLFIQKERFGERLRIVWELDEGIEIDIPPLTIQPLVENAIHHGLMTRIQGGEVCICIKDKEEKVEISIIDNGIGMNLETINPLIDRRLDKQSGIGLLNTDRRLKQLFGQGLIINSKLGEGTTISFTVPKTGSKLHFNE